MSRSRWLATLAFVALAIVPPGVQAKAVKFPGDVRPQNARYNANAGRPFKAALLSDSDTFKPYAAQITAGKTGTTQAILAWGGQKWGFDRDWVQVPDGTWHSAAHVLEALATVESWWRQNSVGDGGDSVGIMQLKVTVWPDSKLARDSTSYGVDYAGARWRWCLDGKTWLGDATKGSLVACANLYVDGTLSWNWDYKEKPQQGYARYVARVLVEQPWLQKGF